MEDKDLIKESRTGFYAWEKVGLGQIHLDDMVLSGAATFEIVDGKPQYRVKVEGCPDVIYRQE